MSHNSPCTFTKPHYGIVVCDQGEHEQSFCITCGTGLPSYMEECPKCEEAAAEVPFLSEILQSTRRTLVYQKRKELEL